MKTNHLALSALVMMSACASFRDGDDHASERPQLTPQDPTQLSVAPQKQEHEAGSDNHKQGAPVTNAHTAPVSTSTAAAHGAAHAGAAQSGVSPEESLGWLKNGNLRFIKNHRRSDGMSAKDRLRLSAGQKPHAIVLSCSDSRVPPEMVFDQSLGEIFVIRVAGEAVDASVLGSIEYAVEHLGSRLIFVLGHESCGAVKAALQTPPGQSAGSESLDRIVANLQPHMRAHGPITNVVAESSENAKGVALDLVNRSPIIRAAVASGKVKVTSGLYYMKSGQVEFFQ